MEGPYSTNHSTPTNALCRARGSGFIVRSSLCVSVGTGGGQPTLCGQRLLAAAAFGEPPGTRPPFFFCSSRHGGGVRGVPASGASGARPRRADCVQRPAAAASRLLRLAERRCPAAQSMCRSTWRRTRAAVPGRGLIAAVSYPLSPEEPDERQVPAQGCWVC